MIQTSLHSLECLFINFEKQIYNLSAVTCFIPHHTYTIYPTHPNPSLFLPTQSRIWGGVFLNSPSFILDIIIKRKYKWRIHEDIFSILIGKIGGLWNTQSQKCTWDVLNGSKRHPWAVLNLLEMAFSSSLSFSEQKVHFFHTHISLQY